MVCFPPLPRWLEGCMCKVCPSPAPLLLPLFGVWGPRNADSRRRGAKRVGLMHVWPFHHFLRALPPCTYIKTRRPRPQPGAFNRARDRDARLGVIGSAHTHTHTQDTARRGTQPKGAVTGGWEEDFAPLGAKAGSLVFLWESLLCNCRCVRRGVWDALSEGL